jgi:hypothetical protein
MLERSVRPCPELEPRLTAGLLDSLGELRPLLDERLVHDHEHLFAGLEPPSLDQIPAPARRLVTHRSILSKTEETVISSRLLGGDRSNDGSFG